jgi:outer membrane protein TolC
LATLLSRPLAAATLALLLCGAGAVGDASAQSRDTLRFTLSEAVARALDVSPEVADVATQQRFAEARYDFARANRFLTTFELTTAHALVPGIDNPNDTATDRLYLDPDVSNDWTSFHFFNQLEANVLQPIYTWGELSQSIAAARKGIDVEIAAVDGKAAEVALRTAELYYDVQLAEALERLTEEAGNIVQRAKREISRLLEEGAPDVDDADLFQVLITEETFNRQVTEVVQKKTTAIAATSRQLFLPEGSTAAVTGSLERLAFRLDSLGYYQGVGLDQRPLLQKAAAGLEAQSALLRAEKSNLYPKLFLGASYRISYTPGRYRQPNPYISDPLRGQSARVGLGLRQNLNLLQTRGKIRQATAKRDQVQYQQVAARQLVLFEIEQAYRNVIIRESAANAQENALRISREWLQTETINFDLDIGDTENLVRAVQTNLSLQAEMYQTVREYNVAVIRLLHASGILIPTLQSGTLVGITND